jgi:N-terminal domain of anti-restriction factor ArdC
MDTSFRAILETALTQPGTLSTAYAAFHNYSLGNQMLALMQCEARGIPPGPLATFPGWKDKGRFVKKGEKALMLCMPITIKAKATEPETDDATFTRFVYKNNWFVVSQTDGAELEPMAVPSWDAARALAALDVTEIPFTATDGNCQGFATQRAIAVSPVAALPYKTRFHELAHVMLGHTAEADQTDGELTPRSLREVEAEAVALLCLEVLGLPGAEFCRGYIQHWNQTRGAEAIPERSAQRIFKAADQIVKAGQPAKE